MSSPSILPIMRTQALFKLLGFRDRNGNSLIEKPSIYNLWQADENYKEEADIDKDGIITEAEAKLNLLTRNNINKETKKEYKLTVSDKAELMLCYFRKIENDCSGINDPVRRTDAAQHIMNEATRYGIICKDLYRRIEFVNLGVSLTIPR